MKTFVLPTLTVVMIFVSSEAIALKDAVDVKFDNLTENGFAVTSTKSDDGRVTVRVTRDLCKAKSFPAASDLRVVRSALLEISGPSKLIARCTLEADRKEGKIEYRFDISPEFLAHSRLTISEIDDYKERLNREHLIGGGTFYALRFADVIKPERSDAN